MRKIISAMLAALALNLTGCMSMESINAKIAPVGKWYEQEYEESRFSQRYKFTRIDIEMVKREILNAIPQIGMTITGSSNDIVATGNPTTMFTTAECESWKSLDEEKTKQLSSGLIQLTCDASNKDSIIVATFILKKFSAGTLLVLDYELSNPTFAAYGLTGPKRPPPSASKAGAEKFWNIVEKSLPHSLRTATKEDLQ